MPQKNKGKGGKRHRKAKKGASTEVERVNAPFKQKGQEYAQVTKMLGNRRILARLLNQPEVDENENESENESKKKMKNNERLCIIPGKFRKRIWINKEDLILVGTREAYSDGKCDVIYKYSARESRQLIKAKEIPSNVQIYDPNEKEAETENNNDQTFVFQDDDGEDLFFGKTDDSGQTLEIDLADI